MERDSRAEWRRGWPLVLAAMLGIGFGPGLFQNVSSLFIDGITREFGWSRGEIATAAALGLLGGVVAPFLGRLADRIGIRPVIIASLLLLGATYVGMAAQTGGLMQFQLLVVLLAFAVPGTSSVVYGKLIAACFVRQRGLALGIATSGLSATMLVMPPVVQAAIASGGWRAGYLVLAVATSAVALPVVLWLLRGVPWTPTARAAVDRHADAPVEGVTGKEARRDRRFWQLGVAVALVNVGSVGLVTQLVPLGEERGLDAGSAALLLTSYAASQVAGRVVIGALVDRFAAPRVAGAVALVSAAAFAGLLAPDPGFAAMMLLVFLAGLMNGAEHDLLPFLTARLFGLRAYGEVYGSLLPISLAGTAGGIVVFGRIHDAFGHYDPALGVAIAALVGAALAFATLTDRNLPEARAAVAPA